MNVEQIDLFALDEPVPIPVRSNLLKEPVLNGFYYEVRSRRFVSFVQGRRHYEILASRCKAPKWPKEWQEKIMKERAI